MKRLLTQALAALALAVPAAGVSSAPAAATSFGCTFEPGTGASYACLTVVGTGLYVDHVRVTRNNPMTSICNYKAKFVVHAPDGRVWRFYSPFHRGCSWNTAWMDIAVGRSFPNNSRGCGHWFEMGHWLPGVPCETIHR
jgi:hypothetical protein